ncbi:hypothetical protein [Chitinophaga filiformis]|uniref:Polysaccharide lyase n=1 Tax=Chitinophaga filiformis TaxID=104663 RepID=A0ABY4I072_CHIFI|nr:hypothetical protein [Chitinophaga filiformis]UPK69058.1 hypothetical protein MYF79_29300 [Chitinophaga filiformis]
MKNASPCFHNSLFTIVIVLLGLTVVSCSKDDDEVTPNPDMNALYAQSIKDAMVDNGSEAIDTLWPVSASNPRLQWKTINGQSYVLMATFMRYPESFPAGDSITTTWGDSWFFIPSQMLQKLGPGFTPSSDTIQRISQLLGLPPVNSKSNTHIAQVWVHASKLFRPAGDTAITTTTTGSTLVSSVPDEYRVWFNNNIIYSYYRPLNSATDYYYPWTRLGYTYDWAPGANRVGLSEYVLKASSGCWVEKTTTAAGFFR